MLTKRTHIMLDEKRWSSLAALAKMRETTTGELIRSAIEKTYFDQNEIKKSRKAAVESIWRHRVHVLGINYKELINEGRKY